MTLASLFESPVALTVVVLLAVFYGVLFPGWIVYGLIRHARAQVRREAAPVVALHEPDDFDDIDRELARILADDAPPVTYLRPAKVIPFPGHGGSAA